MLRRRAAPLRFWQKIYLTTLALFLVCLFGGVWGAATVSCRLSFSARCDEFLARQRAFVQRAAEDIPVLTASRPAALDALYEYYGQQARADGLRAGIWLDGEQLLNDLPLPADGLTELQTLQPASAAGRCASWTAGTSCLPPPRWPAAWTATRSS